MARMLPSCAQLPFIWNREMDRFVCECDALGEFNVKLIIRLLKKKWPYELGNVVVTPEAVERRIYCMDQSLNDYFRKGMLTAVSRLESRGIFLPPPGVGLESSSSKESISASMLHPARHWGRASADFSNGERPLSSGGLRMVQDLEDERAMLPMADTSNMLSNRAYVPPAPAATTEQDILDHNVRTAAPVTRANENDNIPRANGPNTLPSSQCSDLLSRRDASNAARRPPYGGNPSESVYDVNTDAAEGPSIPRSISGRRRLVDRVQPLRTDSKQSNLSSMSTKSRKVTQML